MPLTTAKSTPPRDALPPHPQRATPAHKGARRGAAAGSPRPHQPHREHTGRGTPAARPRGQAAGGGTAADTRRPSQRWQATPPGDGPPPPPRHAAPVGRARQGDNAGTPHPHTRTHSTWVVELNSPPGGRAARRGGAPDPRCPSQRRKAPPPGMPFCHIHSAQRRPTRAHAAEQLQGPHAHTNRTGDTRVAGPRLPAPEDGRPGEGRRLTRDARHNGGRPPTGDGPPPPPRHTAPAGHASQRDSAGTPHPHTRARSTWEADPDSPHRGQAARDGGSPDPAPHNGGRYPPRGRPSATPTASNAGPQGRTLRGRCRVPTPAPAATGTQGSRNPGCPPQRTGGQGRDSTWHQTPLGTGAGHPPPGTPPLHPRGTRPPEGTQAKGTVLGPPTHTPAPTARG